MFFCKFPRFSGYSRPSSSTIRSTLWENAHPSLAAVGLQKATAGGALLPTFCSFLFSTMVSNSDKLHLQAKATQLRCLSQRFVLLLQVVQLACKPAIDSSTHVVSFVTLETRAIRTLNLLPPKPSPGTKYRPTPNREAFNHKTLRLQIQPAKHPQMRPQHHWGGPYFRLQFFLSFRAQK